MAHYAILRALDPNMTQQDVDAGAIRSLFELGAINVPPDDAWQERLSSQSGIGWIRSYWHQGSNWGICLYTARTLDELEFYHRECSIPFVEFREVEELSSPATTDPVTGRTRAPRTAAIFAADARVPTAASCDFFDDIANLVPGRREWSEGATTAIRWVRSYVDQERERALAVYVAPLADALDAITGPLEAAGAVVRPIVEIYPEDYLRE